ncbi:bifunctional demethylmenaquinone methyltransferase/2-methoxy-6-polyprenyl-1,4-benzoquinol methylase UbiE [Planctomycetota bacterium]|nr:bifunctional demethylmenaquinone methyltransferase/2-methoxy-6-polyprenyl-1,4-benzoquinol methylase UbiE [Planctomycetota bacterium]
MPATDTKIEPKQPKLRGDSDVDPQDQSRGRKVRGMFGDIAGRYDLLNRIISGGRDQAWRRKTVRMAELSGSEAVLDVCCGTGDLALMMAVAEKTPSKIVASDFTPEMLDIASAKAKQAGLPLNFCTADALCLPFDDASFDVVSVGYGVRNFQELDKGLAELARVLRPDGRLVILECTPRKGIIGWFANTYINRVVPFIGNLLTKSRSRAYSYLADSIQVFPDAKTLVKKLEKVGLQNVKFKKLNLGTMAIHVATKPRQD